MAHTKPVLQLVSPWVTGEEGSLLSVVSPKSLIYLEKHGVLGVLVKHRVIYLGLVYLSISLTTLFSYFSHVSYTDQPQMIYYQKQFGL